MRAYLGRFSSPRTGSANWDDLLNRVFVVGLQSRGVGNKDCLSDKLYSEDHTSEVTLMERNGDGNAASRKGNRVVTLVALPGAVFHVTINRKLIYSFFVEKLQPRLPS